MRNAGRVSAGWSAIAAMSLNRVIGANNRIPWHLPEDFQWFQRTTTGHVLVMGRKTFESIGRPLPQRRTIVLSRSGFAYPGVVVARDWDEVVRAAGLDKVFICGGAQVYAEGLPRCADLYLTLVKRVVPGDTLFPAFEEQFTLEAELMDRPEFRVLYYRRRPAAG